MLKNLEAIPSLAPTSIILTFLFKFKKATPLASSSKMFVYLIKYLTTKYNNGWLLTIFSKKYKKPELVFDVFLVNLFF